MHACTHACAHTHTHTHSCCKIYQPIISDGKLASLEEFKVQKEDLMHKFAMMEEELAKNEQDHKDEIYRLERKQVIDKDM